MKISGTKTLLKLSSQTYKSLLRGIKWHCDIQHKTEVQVVLIATGRRSRLTAGGVFLQSKSNSWFTLLWHHRTCHTTNVTPSKSMFCCRKKNSVACMSVRPWFNVYTWEIAEGCHTYWRDLGTYGVRDVLWLQEPLQVFSDVTRYCQSVLPLYFHPVVLVHSFLWISFQPCQPPVHLPHYVASWFHCH